MAMSHNRLSLLSTHSHMRDLITLCISKHKKTPIFCCLSVCYFPESWNLSAVLPSRGKHWGFLGCFHLVWLGNKIATFVTFSNQTIWKTCFPSSPLGALHQKPLMKTTWRPLKKILNATFFATKWSDVRFLKLYYFSPFLLLALD